MGIDKIHCFQSTRKLVKPSVFLGIFCIILLLFPLGFANAAGLCATPYCEEAAQSIIKNMLPDANPCTDFYEYACGGLLNKYSQDDETHPNLLQQLRKTVEDRIESEFSITTQNTINFPALKKVHDFYASCMKEEIIEEKGLSSLKSKLEKLGGWPLTTKDWDETNFDLTDAKIQIWREGLEPATVFNTYTVVDFNNSRQHILMVDVGWLFLNYDNYFQRYNTTVVEAYLEALVDLAMEFGAPSRGQAKAEMNDVLDLEFTLANISYYDDDLTSASSLYKRMTVSQLKKACPYISWYKYISGILEGVTTIGRDEEIFVFNLPYFQRLNKVLNDTPKRTIANYLIVQAVLMQAPYLTKKIQLINQNLQQTIDPTSTQLTRNELCLGETEDRFESIVSAVYVRKYFTQAKKAKVEQMADVIRNEFIKVLQNVDWMTPSDFSFAKEKIKKLTYLVDAPQELFDDNVLDDFYKSVTIDAEDFFGNIISTDRFGRNFDLSLLREEVNKTVWFDHSSSTTVGIYYSSVENIMEIHAALLEDLVYSLKRPDYLNYALLGYLIGYKQTTTLDYLVYKFDGDGNLKGFWDNKTTEGFNKRLDEVADELSTFVDPEVNLTLSGDNLKEIATYDQGGFMIAYQAFRTVEALQKQDRLIHLEEYTSGQLFWLWAANRFCSAISHDDLEQIVESGDYPPPRFRINEPFRNSPYFSLDWNCTVDSYMNPKHKVNVWETYG